MITLHFFHGTRWSKVTFPKYLFCYLAFFCLRLCKKNIFTIGQCSFVCSERVCEMKN